MIGDAARHLRAQLDEDERVAQRGMAALSADDGNPLWPDYQTYDDANTNGAYDYLRRFQPRRMLAEIEAKRKILDAYQHVHDDPARLTDPARHLVWNVLGKVVCDLARARE